MRMIGSPTPTAFGGSNIPKAAQKKSQRAPTATAANDALKRARVTPHQDGCSESPTSMSFAASPVLSMSLTVRASTSRATEDFHDVGSAANSLST